MFLSILFKTLIAEFYVSISVMSQLLINTNFIMADRVKSALLDKELLSQIGVILGGAILIYLCDKVEAVFYGASFITTTTEYLLKSLFVSVFLCCFATIWRAFLTQKLNFFEFFTILLFSILALLLVINTLDLLFVYLLVELQALCFYILSCFSRKSNFSTEAGLKYFISGAFISGFFLFGSSLFFISLGSLNLNAINLLSTFSFRYNLTFVILLGVSFITTTFFFKVAAVPFHFWSPDVYEGSPLSSTIIFLILPKLVIFSFLTKWFASLALFSNVIGYLVILTGMLSLIVGTLFAVTQKRIKRFLIFSSIGQSGFLFLSFSANTFDGLLALYYFLFVYLITSILIWSFISLCYAFQKKSNLFNSDTLIPIYMSDLLLFHGNNKLWSAVVVAPFFSMAGIPPFVGFFPKYFIIQALIREESFFLAFSLVMISAISNFYYMKIIKIATFETLFMKSLNSKRPTVFNSLFMEIDVTALTILFAALFYFSVYPGSCLIIIQNLITGNTLL